MKQKYFLFLISCLFSLTNSYSQERVNVQGKIVSKARDLEGIYIENISSRKNTTTEKGGYFKIAMQPNDTLIFASINLKGIRRIVKESDLSKKLIFIPMETSETILDELVIDRRITTESLGFAPKKRYTPAEKRLVTATTSAGGIIAIDKIVNALSGRTDMLKKALEYEREVLMAEKIINAFDEDYFVEELHIPQKYIEGFGYYLSQDSNIIKLIDSRNRTQLKFLLNEKALEYLEILKVLQ